MIRVLSLVCAVAVTAGFSSVATAADPFRSTGSSQVSGDSLSAMGLSGARVITHTESSQIRGQGAIAFGRSSSSFTSPFGFGSSFSNNGYFANNPNFSGGLSFATSGPFFAPTTFGAGFSLSGGF